MAVKELRRRLAAADAETPGSGPHAWIERFATVTTRMYYQKVTAVAFWCTVTLASTNCGVQATAHRDQHMGAHSSLPKAWHTPLAQRFTVAHLLLCSFASATASCRRSRWKEYASSCLRVVAPT